MLKRTILTMLIMLFSVVLVSADGVDDQGNPNDPDVNNRANACFYGGAMEGKCDTEWEWYCGWHVIRLDAQDEVSRAAFPQGCVSLLPAYIEYVAPVSAPSAGCVQTSSIPESINFAGGYFWPVGGTFYNSADCTGGTGLTTSNIVYAPAPFDALTLCNLNGAFTLVFALPMGDVYKCT